MNKRILKLAKKSGATVNEGYDGTKKFVYGITMSPEELDKFAELIIQECADVCQGFGESGDGYTCSYEILEHFGVEE